jgi:hypothetical protein
MSVERMMTVGRELLSREPGATDDQVRAYLLKEFFVERDGEVVFLRSGLWPLAFLGSLFRSSRAARASTIHAQVELAIQQLRLEREANSQ